MRIKVLLLLLISTSVLAIPALGETLTENYIDGGNRTVSTETDWHLTDRDPLRNGATVDLQSPDSWLFFDNVKPSVAIDKYVPSVTVNGEAIEPGVNARAEMYLQGTVIIPQADDFVALEAWTGENYTGEKAEYVVTTPAYQELGEFDNVIKSIKLKRGYMATLANESNGRGYSKVFIADNEDIEIPVLQSELNGKVSFIRCFRWHYVSKKGWCSATKQKFNELSLTNSTWFYTWSAAFNSIDDAEYAVIKQHETWPGFPAINSKEEVTHLLGYNEPDRPEQANATVETAIRQWPKMMESGLRLGTPAIADNFGWLYSFLDECKARNYRVDFVAIHAYWGGPGGAKVVTDSEGNVDIDKWYKGLKEVHDRTGLPIWITEWNNGAGWTRNKEPWPGDSAGNAQKARADLEKIIKLFDETPWIERYSIFNRVGDETAIVIGQTDDDGDGLMDGNGRYTVKGLYNQKLSYAGEFYAANNAPMAYNSEYAGERFWQTLAPSVSAAFDSESRSVAVSWIDYMGEITDEYAVERSLDGGSWTVLATGKGAYDKTYEDTNVAWDGKPHRYVYRIRIKVGGKEEVSNEVSVDIPAMSGIEGHIGQDKFEVEFADWSLYVEGVGIGTGLEIYSMNGTLIARVHYEGEPLDVSGLAAGIYFIRNSAGEVARFIVK